MKIIVKTMAVMGIFLIIFYSATYFYRRSNSERIAFETIQQYCREAGYDVSRINGPIDGRVGNCPASYSWTYEDAAHHLELLVSFDYLYGSKLAIWNFDRKD